VDTSVLHYLIRCLHTCDLSFPVATYIRRQYEYVDLSGMQRSRIESRSSAGSLVNADALAVATKSILKQLNLYVFRDKAWNADWTVYKGHKIIQATALAWHAGAKNPAHPRCLGTP
jgi:hypothetical protein